jgi:ATP-dependent Lon protease
VGLVHGLAWTATGGDLLNIEVLFMPGQGKVIYTGNLGEVMTESMQTAWSFTKSHAMSLGMKPEFFKKHDVHVHVPEGATPKDGPSAGMAIATAMVSAVTKVPVAEKIAMTGEMTLHGEILAIGGVKEKLLAAQRAGISKVLLPKKNQKDVLELDKQITEGLEIRYVVKIADVLQQALQEPS